MIQFNDQGQSRRTFLKFSTTALAAGMLHTMVTASNTESKKNVPYISMVALPYAMEALEPYISKRTVNVHYNDHHKSYYNRLKAYIDKNPSYDKIPLEQLVIKTKDGILLEDTLYNIAVLLWNHNFYWQCMQPNGGILSEKESVLSKNVIDSFGSIDAFKNQFIEKSMEIGIGWVWLVRDDKNSLQVIRTLYHDSPLPSTFKPLLTLDVWEHAYYLDYEFNRQKYVENYINYLVNWKFAESQYLSQTSPMISDKPVDAMKKKSKN